MVQFCDRVRDRDGHAVLPAATGGRAVIGQERAQSRRRSSAAGHARVRIGIRPGTIGGYAILGLLALIYLIPLLFVLFVSLMSSRQFALNAASFPDPIMWSNYPDAWVKGSFNIYFVNTLIYTFVDRVRDADHRHAGGLPDRAQPRARQQRVLRAVPVRHLAAGGHHPAVLRHAAAGHLRHAAGLHPALAQPGGAADLHHHRLHQEHPVGARRRGGDRRLLATSATSSRSSCR